MDTFAKVVSALVAETHSCHLSVPRWGACDGNQRLSGLTAPLVAVAFVAQAVANYHPPQRGAPPSKLLANLSIDHHIARNKFSAGAFVAGGIPTFESNLCGAK
jgi:hypothetical protein